MAPAVELEKPSTPPARCLAFIKSDPTFKLPFFSKSTFSRKQVSSRASQEENHGGDIFSEVGALRDENSRPKSEVNRRDRQTSSPATCRPCSTHPRLQREFRAPMGSRGEQRARPPQFDVGREPLHGFPLYPPGTELAGRGGPRRGGPPCCPRCRSQPCCRLFGGRLGARGLPLRASMVPNGRAAQQVLSPGHFVGMAPMRPPLLQRPGMEMIPGGVKQPPRAGNGSRLPPGSVAGMTSRSPRPAPPGFPRGPRAPMCARLGRKLQYERRVIMDPRTMAGRGRGRPPRPEEAMDLRGQLLLPNPEGPSSSSDIFTAAPSRMSALKNDGEFAQPVQVSLSTPKDGSASPSHDATFNSVVATADSTTSKMPPGAKPHGSNTERSTPNENSGKIDGQEASSPEKESLSPSSRQDGVRDWLQSSQIAGTSMIATALQICEGDMTAVANDGGVQFCASSSAVEAKDNTSVGTLGSWLTSGKLGVSVDHEGEEQVPPIVGAITEENKQKGAITAGKNSPQSDAAQASGAPGGWLPQAVSSGVLGVPQDNDAQESGDKPNNRQTEESPKVTSVEGKCRSSLDRGMPPWAENPPSTGPSHRITGVDRIKSGITSVQVETSKSSGFDRAKEVTASGSSPHAAVASAEGPLANAANGILGPSMVVSSLETNEAVNEGSGPDSLGVMATLDQKELSPRGAPKVAKLKRRTSLATVKVEECYDRDLGIRKTDSRSGRLSAAGVKRIGELLTALARELGEWLESGSRGDLVDDENEGELKGEYGGGGRLVTYSSEETQTEDVIEGTVKEGTESESKLLRRAKPWSSTQGPGKIVYYSSPRVNTKKKKGSATTTVTPDRVLKSMESPGDGRGVSPAEHSAIVTDVGGLDRVDQAVDSTGAPGWDTNESSWEGRAGKASQSSEDNHLLPCRESSADSKASVKNVPIASLTPLEETEPAMAVGDASIEKIGERKHGNCAPFAKHSNQPSRKSSNHTCASVKNVASSVSARDEAVATTTTKETARERNRRKPHKQDVPSRPPFIQSVGLQEMECARPRKETEEVAQLTEATGKSSTGIQCGKTITGAAPVSVVGNTLGIQVDLGGECRRSMARVLRVDA